jgi:hypothetical protein
MEVDCNSFDLDVRNWMGLACIIYRTTLDAKYSGMSCETIRCTAQAPEMLGSISLLWELDMDDPCCQYLDSESTISRDCISFIHGKDAA